jgi:hypothetical protein
MTKLNSIAAAATVVGAVLVIGASIADLMGAMENDITVSAPHPLIVTLFVFMFVFVAILVLLQWYLWIAMLTVCIRQKRLAWAAAVLFGLSWGAALFYYLHHRRFNMPSTPIRA